MFIDVDIIMYLLVSDTFTITPLMYQLMVGIGSPVAWHVKVAKSLPSSVESTMSDKISGAIVTVIQRTH